MRLIGPLRLPLSAAAAVSEGLLELALAAVRGLRSVIDEPFAAEPAPPRPAPPRPAPPRRPTAAPVPPRPPTAAPASPSTAPPAPPPVAPPVPDEVKTIDDAPVPVAEFGEEGAEEPAGAEVHVDQPWDGYDAMTVAQVRARLKDADQAALAAVVLYEELGKGRRSVISDAEKRLARLVASRP